MTQSKALITRPDETEYAPYYGKYISLVPDGDIINTLNRQLEETLGLLASIPETEADHRYAADKWSIKEVVGHIADSERIFAYRALRFARNDRTPLPGFEQNGYVENGDFTHRQLAGLAQEFEDVRRGSLHLFQSLGEEAWTRRGTASEVEVSVRALAYIIAGHELHHLQVLRTRYL